MVVAPNSINIILIVVCTHSLLCLTKVAVYIINGPRKKISIKRTNWDLTPVDANHPSIKNGITRSRRLIIFIYRYIKFIVQLQTLHKGLEVQQYSTLIWYVYYFLLFITVVLLAYFNVNCLLKSLFFVHYIHFTFLYINIFS